MPETDTHRAGFVALVGRPNTGKSSLLNRLLGQKVSIVTPRAQTTRHRILGIHSTPEAQVVFVDTPGMHQGHRRRLNRTLNRTALASLDEADLCVLVAEAGRWTSEDGSVLERAVASGRPLILVLNKIDLVKPRDRLLAMIDEVRSLADFIEIVPTSAQNGENVDAFLAAVTSHLPESPRLFPDDQITDRSERFQIAERIREQLMWNLREELPYGVSVDVERMKNEGSMLRVNAVIYIERTAHKPIVIGRGGKMLEKVGKRARESIQKMLERKVHLALWVKVRPGWPDDERALRELGYEEG